MKRNACFMIPVLAALLELISQQGFAGEAQFTKADLTGNWCDTSGFESTIRTREPELQEQQSNRFCQQLKLSRGLYTIYFEYDPFWDKADGYALQGQFENWQGFRLNGVVQPLSFKKLDIPQPDYFAYRKEPWQAVCPFEVQQDQAVLDLSLSVRCQRPFRTWIESTVPLKAGCQYRAVKPDDGGQLLVAHGVPFLVDQMRWYLCGLGQKVDHGTIRPWEDGYTIDCGRVSVKAVHFLGMVHNIDIGNGSWYSPKGDHGYNHFVGDQAGTIIIHYADGSQSTIPIIYGFNLWFARPWDMIWHYNWGWDRHRVAWIGDLDKNLFSGIDAYRDVIRSSVGLVDGVRAMGSASSNTRFIFSVDLENKAVKSISVQGAAIFHDYPLISGITLETADSGDSLIPLPELAAEPSNLNPVSLDYINKKKYEPSLDALKRLLYNYVDQVPQLSCPEVPEGYFGPTYDFRGTQEALRAATYLYYNGPGNASFIADSGMGCTSPVFPGYIMQYMDGAGFWFHKPVVFGSLTNWFRLYQENNPGRFPGGNNAWTRGAGENLRECIAFGYDKYVTAYVDWLDNALMTEANPPHWNRIAGGPGHATYQKMVGDVEERGNRENDGHGICMWGRYMVWHWLGRPQSWNADRWKATESAVDWIQWQLDTDTIRPGVDKDVLYTESECAHDSYDIYSSYNCLHGLKLSIRMAEQLHKTETAAKWKKLHDQLQQGILDHLVDDSDSGPIWHTDPKCDWQDHAHKLAHIQLASDGITYTPLEDYTSGKEADYLKIDLNTYRYLMKEKNYNCLRMYGYGQGMMTQAALLLDQMADAEQFSKMMLDHCYLGRFGRWASPEGIILHRSGEYYLPVNGYMGQDAHIADSTKAVRLMLGVDDNNPDHLRLVPRYPSGWNYMEIKDYPALIGGSRQKLAYQYQRQGDTQTFKYSLENQPQQVSVRLGPIAETAVAATLNGKPIESDCITSGDSRWVWIRNISEKAGTIVITAKR